MLVHEAFLCLSQETFFMLALVAWVLRSNYMAIMRSSAGSIARPNTVTRRDTEGEHRCSSSPLFIATVLFRGTNCTHKSFVVATLFVDFLPGDLSFFPR